jgi:hypothetical protein
LRNLRRSFSRTGYRSRLCLEYLEERTLPANVFVVPMTVPVDATHFHSMADAAAAAGTNGLVTVEPGAEEGLGPIPDILADGVTIQGDPSVQPSALGAYSLGIGANHITLTHMHLYQVNFTSGSARFTTISHCLISGSLQPGGSVLPQEVLISQNVFDGGNLSLGGDNADVTAVDNVFNQGALSVFTSAAAIVRGNRFVGDNSGIPPVGMLDAGTSAAPVVFQDNEILLSNPGIIAIQIDLAGDNGVNVLNNRIYTSYLGTAIKIDDNIGDFGRVLIQGNDLQGNRVGVSVTTTNPSPSGTSVDLGSSLGSLGGNDFRGFTSPATSTDAAISFSVPSMIALSARNNIFSAGVDPNSVINDATHGSHTGSGTIDVGSPLSQAQAFVQTLYNHLLRRTGSLEELVPWTNLLVSAGQPAVVTGILHSPESLGRIVDDLYMRVLGRQSDPIGRNDWIGFLASGGSVEQLEDVFLTSPEYIGQNANWVQSLYLNVLDRPGSDAEVAAWNNAEPTLGLTAIATAFTSSAEARAVATVSDYRTFLHRTPTAGEVMVVTGLPLDLLGIENFLLLSPEYYSNG